MSLEKIHRVAVRRLNLRSGPDRASGVLCVLDDGQAVVRLDEADRDGWWFVFADTPGDGVFAGYVWRQYLQPFLRTPAPDATVPDISDDAVDDAATPPRETMGVLVPPDEADDHAGNAPVTRVLAFADGWHPGVSEGRRHLTGHQSARPMGQSVRRLVIHITGNPDLESVIKSFRAGAAKASAHYLIAPDGDLHQFVPEHLQSHHAGIKAFVGKLYERGDGSWRAYKRYFQWAEDLNAGQKYKWYGRDAVYLGADLGRLPAERRGAALFVQPAGGGEWPDYAYFDSKWGRRLFPIGYSGRDHSPNADSIGIELLSWGGVRRNPERYSEGMYQTLGTLVGTLCARHGIALTPENVCGHEDVNPVERWGWDPNAGFDWDRLFALSRAAAIPGPGV